jgi:hypothetical protein
MPRSDQPPLLTLTARVAIITAVTSTSMVRTVLALTVPLKLIALPKRSRRAPIYRRSNQYKLHTSGLKSKRKRIFRSSGTTISVRLHSHNARPLEPRP